MGNKSSLMLQDEEIKQISEETGFSSTQIEKLYTRFAHLDKLSCGSLSKSDLISIPELAINPLCDRLIRMFFSGCDSDEERINFRQFVKVLAIFRSTSDASSTAMKSNQSHETIKSADVNRKQMFHSRNTSIVASLSGNTTRNFRQSRSETTRFGNSELINRSLLDGVNEMLKDKLLFVFRIYDVDNDGRISFDDLRSILKMMVGNYIEDVQLDKIATRAFIEVDEDNDGFIEAQEFCKVFSGKDLDDKFRIKFFD